MEKNSFALQIRLNFSKLKFSNFFILEHCVRSSLSELSYCLEKLIMKWVILTYFHEKSCIKLRFHDAILVNN